MSVAPDRLLHAVVLGLAVLLCASDAAAQTPADAGSLLRQQEQLEQKLPQRIPEAEPPELTKPALPETPGIKIQVRKIRFSGATDLVPESELQALVAEAIGKAHDFAGLQSLADSVTEYLRRRGFLLARAYLPRQDVTAGEIEIAILRGRLDGSADDGGGWQVTLEDGTRIDADLLDAIAETAAPSGSGVRQPELERALLLMNDLPGVTARSRLEPGTETGTTRVVVAASEGPLLTGSAWTDNYGNDSTGQEQLSAVLNLNDPSGRGDYGGLSVTASQGIRLARLGYSLPLGSQGLRASLGYIDMRYEVEEGSGVAAGLEGDSRILRAGLSHPFVRTRALSLYGSADYQHKALQDDSVVGVLRDKRIDVYALGVNGDSLDAWLGGGLSNFGFILTGGDLDLSKVAADAATDAASLRTQGRYRKVNLSASRLQKLPGRFTLFGRAAVQEAADNLDSSEEFILGGPYGVRAYPVGEAQGDAGWLASVEIRYDRPGSTAWGAWQFSAFVDSGGIRLHDSPGNVTIATATGKNRYRLSGAGLGVNLYKPGSHSLRFAWAHTLGDNDGRSFIGKDIDGKSDASRLWLQAAVWF